MDDPVDVVFPCLNEAGALPSLLAGLPHGYRAIVVDNGSTDDSVGIARAAGARVVEEDVRGYGAAVHAGMTGATADLVVVCDADGTIDPAQFERLVAPIRAGTADLSIGRRRPVSRSAWPVGARIANRRLAGMLRARTGTDIRDLGPVRAARRLDVLSLGIRDRRSGYPVELFLRASAAGWHIGQVDVDYLPRIGRSKVSGTVLGSITAVLDARHRMREAVR